MPRHLEIDVDEASSPRVAFGDLRIAEPSVPPQLRAALEAAVGPEHVSTDPLDRVVHARGKSLRDLVRHRRGEIGRLPDVVVRPAGEDAVAAVLHVAIDADAVVIPFGGGSNISGSLEPPEGDTRTIVSIDLGRMDRVLAVDETARLARVQTGVFGPQLEEQLNARGWTLGHFPDSFAHSTLGGWIATRSSGMQSDKYGDAADLTRAVRVVTPSGLLATRPVPATSTGPSVREMILGSEGRLGILSEATVHVHRVPARRTILGYLLPTWAAGLAAMHDIAAAEVTPDRGALADVSETAAPWSLLPTVYDNVMGVAREAFRSLGVPGYIMCHLSHSYHSGACLYFTFAFKPSGARDPLAEYDVVKSAIQQSFLDSGATLSHHHAVGTEHAAWLEQDISAPGVAMLRALFDGVDPGGNLNPGKVI